jgi:hypothetical protein
MKITKAMVEAKAKELNVEVEIGGGRYFTVDLTAPNRKILRGPQLHMTVTEQSEGISRDKVWEAVMEDLSRGLEDCTDDDCDTCEGES